MLTDEDTESKAQRDDNAESKSEVKRMPDYYSSAANFIKKIESKVERVIDEMIAKKKAKKERKNKINKARFTVFDIFDFLDFEEEDDDNKPKYTILDILDILDFEEEDDNMQKKKQEMINNAEIYVSAFEQMLRDFKNKNFNNDGSYKTMKKAERYVNAFEQMLRDFKSQDVGGNSSKINN